CEAQRRIEAFRARSAAPVRPKTDTLLNLERLPHPRIVPFLLDAAEPIDLRYSAFTSLQRHLQGLATAHELSFANRRHVSVDQLDTAIKDLINAYPRCDLPKV